MKLNFIPLLAFLFLCACSNNENDSATENLTPIVMQDAPLDEGDSKQKKDEGGSSYNGLATFATGTASNVVVNLQDKTVYSLTSANDVSFASSASVEKKIIKNATVKFQVKELSASSKNVEMLTKKYGAYISSSNQGTNYNSLFNTISIRVPANKFEELLNEVLKESIYLESKNITSQDVTEEYVDTETRIKTKKDIEQRYKEILRQAKSIEEILAVEAKLAEIREEIEAKEGRLKFLGDNVQYSTIQLEIYETVSGQVQPEYGFFSKLGESLSGGWNGLLSFFLGIVRIWPLLLILGFVLILLKRWRNGKKKKLPENL